MSYGANDSIADYGRALNRDILVPRPAGRFLFGRLVNRDEEKLQILPLEAVVANRSSRIRRGSLLRPSL